MLSYQYNSISSLDGKIPICDLYLEWSFSKVDKADIVLHSGLTLPILSSLEKIKINANRAELSEEDIIGLLNYGLQSKIFKELWLYTCTPPASFRPQMIPESSKHRNIKVLWPENTCQLDLQSGKWKQASDIQTITQLCSGQVVINKDTSKSAQRSTIQLLKKASSHDIPIYSVGLVQSFNKVDEDVIYLRSGLSLPILSSLERMVIVTEKGREMNEQEVNGILNYVQQSQRFKQLGFDDCLLPPYIMCSSLSNLKSRNIKVFWCPYGDEKHYYLLDLQSGHWLLDMDPDSFFPITECNDEITTEDYDMEVENFREHYRDYEWQQNN